MCGCRFFDRGSFGVGRGLKLVVDDFLVGAPIASSATFTFVGSSDARFRVGGLTIELATATESTAASATGTAWSSSAASEPASARTRRVVSALRSAFEAAAESTAPRRSAVDVGWRLVLLIARGAATTTCSTATSTRRSLCHIFRLGRSFSAFVSLLVLGAEFLLLSFGFLGGLFGRLILRLFRLLDLLRTFFLLFLLLRLELLQSFEGILFLLVFRTSGSDGESVENGAPVRHLRDFGCYERVMWIDGGLFLSLGRYRSRAY